MRMWLRLLLGTIVLFAAVLVLAPAALIDRPLAARRGDRLRLADASGFWWNGRGTLAAADGTARVPVAWRIELAALARGTLVVRLEDGDDARPAGTLSVDGERAVIRGLHVRVPAAFITALDRRLQVLALGGDVTLDAPAFAYERTGRGGSLAAEWHRARVVTGAVIVDLGTVTLSTAAAGPPLSGVIRNTGGDVALDGTFADRAGVLDATLSVRPGAAAPEAVRALLPSLGTPDGAGGVRVAWRSDR
jgi:hypothetical protein